MWSSHTGNSWMKQQPRIRWGFFFQDIREVTGSYDRILSIAAFEHIADLPVVIGRCGMLLNPGGTLRVAIPSEGTVLWKLAYTLSTGVVFYITYRLNYQKLMRYEHINTWMEIRKILEYFYQSVHSRYFGCSSRLSLYHLYICSRPNIDRCRAIQCQY